MSYVCSMKNEKEQTLGQKRIGGFNPSGSGYIDTVKTKCAELIDLIAENTPLDENEENNVGEIIRLKSMAMTSIEQASMYAVKAFIHYKQK